MLKCVSLYGPWAHLMAKLKDAERRIGAKSNETRSWATSYRGDIAIHAGKVCDREMAADDRVLAALGYPKDHHVVLPAGAVLCVVELYDVVPTSVISFATAFDPLAKWAISDEEYHFGDYSTGRFAWLTRNLRPLREPVRTRGYQKIWTLDPEAERLVREQL